MKHVLVLAAFVATLGTATSALALETLMSGQEAYDKALQSYSCVDYEKAIGMFRKNAELGHGLSQYMMGIMTEQGQGIDANVSGAYDWYMRAAKQGLADAYFALGDLYSRGVGVSKDTVQAYAWFDLADRGGHKLARDMLNSQAVNLGSNQIAQANRIASDWLAKLGR